MNNGVVIFVPNLILLALFIIFLWRRRSLKGFDWVALITIALGVTLLAIVATRIIQSPNTDSKLLQVGLFLVPTVIFILYLLFIFRVLTVETVKTKLHFDERLTAVNAKSARNALVATYLSAVVNLILFPDIARVWLLGILAFGLVVYLVSLIIYHYRSFD
jgi:low affinity Fe/Cu permease